MPNLGNEFQRPRSFNEILESMRANGDPTDLKSPAMDAEDDAFIFKPIDTGEPVKIERENIPELRESIDRATAEMEQKVQEQPALKNHVELDPSFFVEEEKEEQKEEVREPDIFEFLRDNLLKEDRSVVLLVDALNCNTLRAKEYCRLFCSYNPRAISEVIIVGEQWNAELYDGLRKMLMYSEVKQTVCERLHKGKSITDHTMMLEFSRCYSQKCYRKFIILSGDTDFLAINSMYKDIKILFCANLPIASSVFYNLADNVNVGVLDVRTLSAHNAFKKQPTVIEQATQEATLQAIGANGEALIQAIYNLVCQDSEVSRLLDEEVNRNHRDKYSIVRDILSKVAINFGIQKIQFYSLEE